MILSTRTVDTPIGPVVVVAHEDVVIGLEFADARDRRDALARHFERWLGSYDADFADSGVQRELVLRAGDAG